MNQTEKEGRWVYGVDCGTGLPAYSETSYSCLGDAIRAAVKGMGLSSFKFRLVVGKLSKPSPPSIDAKKMLIRLFTDRYDTAEGVLYRPGAEALRWTDTLRLEALEARMNEVLKGWFSEPDHCLGWLEVTDEHVISDADISEAINEIRGSRA